MSCWRRGAGTIFSQHRLTSSWMLIILAALIGVLCFMETHAFEFGPPEQRLPVSTLSNHNMKGHQHRRRKNKKKKRHQQQQRQHPQTAALSILSLVPSQAIQGHPSSSSPPITENITSTGTGSSSSTVEVSSSVNNINATNTSSAQPVRRRRKSPPRKAKKNNSNQTETRSNEQDKIAQAIESDARDASGNLPDVHWRVVSMDDLRQHPLFHALPASPPRTLTCLEDARLFRQGTWQWEHLHRGRCTTSIAVAALGFLEPDASRVLGIPWSWTRHRASLPAFARLREPALRTLEDMDRVLCPDDESSDNTEVRDHLAPVWEEVNQEEKHLFAARFQKQTSRKELLERKAHLQRCIKSSKNQAAMDPTSIRLAWGMAQEASALLTALNYFAVQDPGSYLEEVGMLGAGLERNQTASSSSLLIGASPDSLLHHSGGSVEVLEVKNHCPFFADYHQGTRGRRKKGGRKRFSIRDYPFDYHKHPGLFSQYVPQLMMEMLCVGPECQSAVMVRQTATQGALLLRIQRDDDWIDEMLYWLERFQRDYVNPGRPPPSNFFWYGADCKRYRRFVNRTLEIRSSVQVLCHIPHERIQRVEGDAPFFLDNCK